MRSSSEFKSFLGWADGDLICMVRRSVAERLLHMWHEPAVMLMHCTVCIGVSRELCASQGCFFLGRSSVGDSYRAKRGPVADKTTWRT